MTTFPLKIGSQGQAVTDLDVKAVRRYSKIAFEIDGVTPLKPDAYFGRGEQSFATKFQINKGRAVTGQISEDEWNYIVRGVPFPSGPKGPLRLAISAPGSGADATVGPSFEWGERCRVELGMDHHPLVFVKGGYIGLMGGDPTYSYVDVTYDMYHSLLMFLDLHPVVQECLNLCNAGRVAEAKAKLELYLSAYSQSADGLEDALEMLFGDGGFVIPKTGEIAPAGKYRSMRPLIKGVYNFGNPSRQPNAPMSGIAGYNPAGWGISRKIRPEWLQRIVVSVTVNGDFYACTPDSDTIRPPFYAIIVKANLSTPFFSRILKIAVDTIPKFMPFIALTGPFAPLVLAGLTGLTGLLGVLTPLMGMIGGVNGRGETAGDLAVDAALEELLSVQGITSNVVPLFGLVGSLNGINLHGQYQGVQHAEFGGQTGVDVAMGATRHDLALAA